MKPIIEVNGLWKEYRRGAQKEKYLSLRDSLLKSFKKSAKKESFWALEDVNFEVFPGDSLAIIGKNGAGKSTLLKILSRITPPTKGEIILRGRLASLLEVGTGFHGELTGRENVYLNGSILGLGRAEINRQFDAIVSFSEVESFLDTPLKHYSSGMQMRLAFSVAAHLEPEILVIDEVLAVGDSAFQQKCLDKMTQVSNQGRTILFVSHNIAAVKNLCNKGIVLESGKNTKVLNVEDAISSYLHQDSSTGDQIDLTQASRYGKCFGNMKFASLALKSELIQWGDPIEVELQVEGNPDRELVFGLNVVNMEERTMIHASNQWTNQTLRLNNGCLKFKVILENRLRPATYSISLFLASTQGTEDWLKRVARFTVSDGNPYNYNNTDIIQGDQFMNFTIETDLT